MAIYLAEFAGTGGQDDPFRPAVIDSLPDGASWQAIDLRGDPSVGTGYCLVNTSARAADESRATYFEHLDVALTNQQRNFVENQLGIPLDSLDDSDPTLRRAIRNLMVNLGDMNNPDRWNPVQPDQFGRVRVYLGELITDE